MLVMIRYKQKANDNVFLTIFGIYRFGIFSWQTPKFYLPGSFHKVFPTIFLQCRFNLFLDPNTTAIEHVLTFHLLYRHLLYRHLLYRHLLYRHLLYRHLLYRYLLYRHLLYRHWIIPAYINTALTRPTVSFGSCNVFSRFRYMWTQE